MPSGRRVPRAVVGVTTAVLAASSLMLLASPSAVAAPSSAPTCSGSADIFDVHSDGTLWLYQHNSPATGAANWSGPTEIGTGWQGTTWGGPGGDIYHVTAGRELQKFHYDVATGTWANGGIGQNLMDWSTQPALEPDNTVDSTGHFFEVSGAYLMMRYFGAPTGNWLDSPTGDALGNLQTYSYNNPNSVFASGAGVLYGVELGGALYRYRYDYASQRWAEYSDKIGTGFDQFTSMFSPGGDVLYAINGSTGALDWYHFDDATQTWDNNGVGQQIGQGWYSSTNTTVFATDDTCSSPSPAPVAPATPVGPSAHPALAAAGDQNGTPLYYFTRDSAGHIDAATDNGATGLSTQQIGQRTFAGDVYAADAAGGMAVSAVDSSGQVWLSWSQKGATAPDFIPLGGSMTTIGVWSPGPGGLEIDGVDSAGNLWTRYGVSNGPSGPQLTAWEEIWPYSDITGVVGGSFYTTNYNATIHLEYPGPHYGWIDDQTINAPDTIVGMLRNGPVVYNAGQATAPIGPATGPTIHFAALPPIGTTGTVTLAAEPLGAADLDITADGDAAIAAIGSDGNLYYTTNRPNDTGFGPWTQLPGVTPATPPTLLWNGDLTADLVFRGTDGKIYHYTASTSGTPNTPLTFTGGPHS